MYQEEKRTWMKHLDFTVIDLLCMELAWFLAYFWRFHSWLFENPPYVRIAILLVLIDIMVIFFGESYSGILRRTKYQEFTATLIHCIIVFAGILMYMYATKQSWIYSRQMLFMFLGLMFFFEYGGRVIWKRRVRRAKLEDRNKAAMIVVAQEANVVETLQEISRSIYTDYKVEGVVVVDRDMTGENIAGIPVVATADTFISYMRKSVVDEVFINGNTRESAEALANVLIELGVTVHIAMVHTNRMMPNRRVENYANYVVLTSSMKIAGVRQLVLKRMMDILGGIVGMIFTGIFFIIFAPIVKIQSPGPIFYNSIRIGKNGRRFKFYKFRTMIVDADQHLAELMEQNEMKGNMFKMENDPRIIPVGRFMRKYSIDEFPQFWNVLKGDMSLVGTRPPTEEEFEKYAFHHKARLGIKPGLTGMWQAYGRNDISDFEEVVDLDTQYITNWTLGLDVMILFKTVAVVLTGKGAK